jgi:hypothetical protein
MDYSIDIEDKSVKDSFNSLKVSIISRESDSNINKNK